VRRTVFTENFSSRIAHKGPSRWATAGYFRVNSNLLSGQGGGDARGVGEDGRALSRDYFFHSSPRDLRILRIKYARRAFGGAERSGTDGRGGRGGREDAPFFGAQGRFLVITPVNCRGRPRSRRLLLGEHHRHRHRRRRRRRRRHRRRRRWSWY